MQNCSNLTNLSVRPCSGPVVVAFPSPKGDSNNQSVVLAHTRTGHSSWPPQYRKYTFSVDHE